MSGEVTNRWFVHRFMIGGYLAVFLLVFGLGAWGALARISGAVIVSGTLEVEGNRQVVQHPTGGVIDKINVRNGDAVGAGDVLIRLEGDEIVSELGIVEGQWFEILARKGRLSAERDGLSEITFDPELMSRKSSPNIAGLMQAQELQFKARQKLQSEESGQLKERQVQIAKQIEGLEAVQAATQKQIDLISREIEGQEALLAKGLTEITRVLTPRRTLAELEGTRGQIEAAVAENKGKIAEIEINLVQLDSKTREDAISELRDLEYREIELRERRDNLRLQVEKLDLRAPVAGVIYGNTADTLRGVVRAAEPVMYIVPKDAPLIVRGHVMPINIDQIHVGQQATMRFSAFDARTTPEVTGHVKTLSADTMEDRNTGSRYYLVDIQLDEDSQQKLVNRPLVPGMPVEAFIGTDERSPLSYFVKPFTDYFSRAMQEG